MGMRQGSGAIVKFIKGDSKESLSEIMAEVDQLTDNDLLQMAGGIKDGTLTY